MSFQQEEACASDINKNTNKTTETFPLMSLPDVVISHLISFLPPKTCLALRRVCKTTLYWITMQSCKCRDEDFEKWKKYRIRITGKAPYTFATVVKMNLPITWFYLQNDLSKQKIYESEGVDNFIKLVFKFRKARLTIDIDILLMLQPSSERAFYSNFENIVELRIHKLQTCTSTPISKYSFDNDDEFFRSQFLNPPLNVVRSLKRLVIFNCEYSSALEEHVSDEYLLFFITSFKNLKKLSPPPKLKKLSRRGASLVEFFMPRKFTFCPVWMGALGTAIVENDWWSLQEMSGGNNKEERLSVDLRGFMKSRYMERTYRSYLQNYLLLLQESHRHGILLRNVSSTVLDSMYAHLWELGLSEDEIRDSFNFLNSTVSLYSAHHVLRFGCYEMQNLEEIAIYHHFGSHQWLYHDPPELSWSSLKTLKVSVHINEHTFTNMGRDIWKLTFGRIFDNAKRSSVTALILRENKEPYSKEESVRKSFKKITIFDASIITNNFTGLTSLTILGCTAPAEFFDCLFSGLPLLTFVSIDACTEFSGSPLSHLSAVTTLVLTLDNMPNIQESFFLDILCRMSIKQFRMIAKKPASCITTQAMLALQEGAFGKTIEKFPFDTWKSKYVSGKKKKWLMKEFRFMK